MYRIQGPKRLAWIRLTGSIDNLLGHAQHLPVGSRGNEVSMSIRSLRFGQILDCHRTQQDPVTFNQRQIRGDRDLRGAEEAPNRGRRRFVQQPREDST